jgi:hypothetical protein
MNRCNLVIMSLLLTVACDPKESAQSSGAASPAKESGALAAKTDAPADAAAPVRFSSLSECLSSCERADVIATNRETCRLNCDTAYGAAAGDRPATGDDPLGRVAGCLGRCYAGADGGDACVSGCKNLAAGATPQPSADVLDRLQACVSTCHLDNTRPTNRETCELNCTQAARVAGTPPPAAR